MRDYNEWLLDKYGITADDMTDDDYDMYYAEYIAELNEEVE